MFKRTLKRGGRKLYLQVSGLEFVAPVDGINCYLEKHEVFRTGSGVSLGQSVRACMSSKRTRLLTGTRWGSDPSVTPSLS